MKEVIDTVSVALASGEVEELGGAVMQEVNRSLLSAGVNAVSYTHLLPVPYNMNVTMILLIWVRISIRLSVGYVVPVSYTHLRSTD